MYGCRVPVWPLPSEPELLNFIKAVAVGAFQLGEVASGNSTIIKDGRRGRWQHSQRDRPPRFFYPMGKGAPCGADDGKAEAGAKLFKAKCATCHTCNEGGPNKQGPNLFGVIGRQSGLVSKQSKVGPARGRARPEASVARDSYRCASPPLPPARRSPASSTRTPTRTRASHGRRRPCLTTWQTRRSTSRGRTWRSRASRSSRTPPTSPRTSSLWVKPIAGADLETFYRSLHTK